jgi:hypothetical protein
MHCWGNQSQTKVHESCIPVISPHSYKSSARSDCFQRGRVMDNIISRKERKQFHGIRGFLLNGFLWVQQICLRTREITVWMVFICLFLCLLVSVARIFLSFFLLTCCKLHYYKFVERRNDLYFASILHCYLRMLHCLHWLKTSQC